MGEVVAGHFAAHARQHRDRNLEALASLLAGLILRPFDPAAAAEFGGIQATQRNIGRPIPPLDAQIAAVAAGRPDAIVRTADRHFSLIQGRDHAARMGRG